MLNIYFKRYDLKNDLDFFNKVLMKASNDRYELRQSKNGKYYLYDFDESGYDAIVRKKEEIKDILDCQYMENFTTKKEYKRIQKVMENI